MKFKMLSEDELLQEALNGSEAHLNVLISTYEPFIMAQIGKHVKNQQDLLDLRQHICSKIAVLITEKNYVHQDKFSNWTVTIVKNEVNSFFRQKKKSVTLNYFSSDVLDEFSSDLLMAAEEPFSTPSELSKVVDKLPEEQAIVLKLRCFKNMTFREIADAVGTSINTVAGRYRYGIERMRELVVQ